MGGFRSATGMSNLVLASRSSSRLVESCLCSPVSTKGTLAKSAYDNDGHEHIDVDTQRRVEPEASTVTARFGAIT